MVRSARGLCYLGWTHCCDYCFVMTTQAGLTLCYQNDMMHPIMSSITRLGYLPDDFPCRCFVGLVHSHWIISIASKMRHKVRIFFSKLSSGKKRIDPQSITIITTQQIDMNFLNCDAVDLKTEQWELIASRTRRLSTRSSTRNAWNRVLFMLWLSFRDRFAFLVINDLPDVTIFSTNEHCFSPCTTYASQKCKIGDNFYCLG